MSVSKTYIAISIVHFRTHFHLAQNVQSRVLWKINKPTVNRQKEKDLSLVRKMDGAQTQRMIANVKLLVHHQKSNFPILKKVFSHQTSIFTVQFESYDHRLSLESIHQLWTKVFDPLSGNAETIHFRWFKTIHFDKFMTIITNDHLHLTWPLIWCPL